MGALINIIILYIIFSLISSFVFKKKKFRRLLSGTMQQEPPSPESPEEQDEPAEEIIPELLDNSIEFAESFPEPPRVESYRSEPRRTSAPPSKKPKIRRANSFLLPSGQDQSYLQGIILSEILGPPVSKKTRKRS